MLGRAGREVGRGEGEGIQELIDAVVVVEEVDEGEGAEGERDGRGDQSLEEPGGAEDGGAAHCGGSGMSGWWG